LGVADGIRRLSRSPADKLRVGGEAACGARVPGELLEEACACASSESLREEWVSQDLFEAFPERFDVPGLDEKTGHAVLDHFGNPAEAAGDDGCPAGHRLDAREAEQL
jgi:hypothetical protein